MKESMPSVSAGGVRIGGGAQVTVQSMTNTDTKNVAETVRQIHSLTAAGCDIVRASVYDMDCAKAFADIRSQIAIPLVADVHFDYRLAIAAMEHGADKLRFNPGNIGDEARVRSVVQCAKMHRVPIRIGVNGGSIEKSIKQAYGGVTPVGMVESAMRHVRILESEGFTDIVISLKASDVRQTVEAYRLIRKQTDYPLHVGVTETGSADMGVVKSAIGIGALLIDGIGDTIRVSLTDDPVREVEAGLKILRALHLRNDDVEIISCPTCGRTRVDLMQMAELVAERLPRRRGYLKVAVMGCAVNGPGEAADADIGIAFGDGNGVLFQRGEKVYHGPTEDVINALVARAQDMLKAKAD